MGYQALYRKWRSQHFSDLIGQDHISRALQNAVLQNKISHAYLFTGARGTGKTSTARIFARAMNCINQDMGEPCNTCDLCVSIIRGVAPDVLEIDAASNNGVDEIRDLCENVKYVPVEAHKKVYIIDEVHMLSTGAFNALLKTLEEPPEHVVFILATTEMHKLPLTIVSRCQCYSFKMLTQQVIIDRMRHILHEEKILFEEDALMVIARVAHGAMRDALSILDQMISFCDEKITLDETLDVTGGAPRHQLAEIVKEISLKNALIVLESLNSLILKGRNPQRIIEELIYFYRHILFIKKTNARDDEFYELAKLISDNDISYYISQFSNALLNMKGSIHSRLFFEATVIELCNEETIAPNSVEYDYVNDNTFKALKAKIAELETTVASLSEMVNKKINEKSNIESNINLKNDIARTREANYSYDIETIVNVLKNATKKNKEHMQSLWQDVRRECFVNNLSHQALLNESEPVAASEEAFVLKFNYDIHCQMAVQNRQFIPSIQQYLKQKTGMVYAVVFLSSDDWQKEREKFLKERSSKNGTGRNENQEIVNEAIRLFGPDIVEVNK